LLQNNTKNILLVLKWRTYVGPEWVPVDRAVEAGKLANVPVMIDFGGNHPPLSIEELYMKHLRPGDIYTHTYALLEGNSRETVVDTATNKVKPLYGRQRNVESFSMWVMEAASFNFTQAIPPLKPAFTLTLSALICIQAA
jgi:dihydroorotase